ncbi:MAG TPA: DUF2267 domain-containing protein [Coleofasciculaceae cyanobacterium]
MPDQTYRKDIPEVDPTEIEDSRVAIADEHHSFLEMVMVRAGFGDLYDARDFTEVVFRVMRDLMTTDTIERVEAELHEEALHTKEKALQMEVADLWKDTNPIVGFLSRIRQPLRGPAPIGIDSKLFLTRIANEGALPPTVEPEQALKAVFSATKEELSEERIQEIASVLPDRVREIWEQA